jgi:two-component system OmpR family sensor kinase
MVGIVALLALASLVIGTVSVLALQGFLMGRLDSQLEAATQRTMVQVGERPPGEAPPPDFDGEDLRIQPGQAPMTITSFVRGDGLVNAGYIDAAGVTHDLTSAQQATLLALPADGEPRTVELGELGQYRVAVSDNRLVGLPLSDVQTTVYQLLATIGGITLLVIAIAFAAGSVVVRLALRPLQRVAATATHVAELPLDRGEVALAERVPGSDADPRTEVGQVGAAINRMLEHVASALSARQASENKVRQFVADASHELRTPLASIRGYAELTRRADHDLPDDVVRALGRVESEATRMTSLVDDLLLLARLDEGRALERLPVDLTRLLIDAVGDAHAAGPDHEWSLDLPEEPIEIQGDQGRLHQVIANLLANARVHTPAGTAVTAALAHAGDEAMLTVTDDGPGIAGDLQPVLFERFARGDGSRSRAAGSTGLGLAIVEAVVTAHGGTVAVASRPGRTEFSVRLPVG